MPIKKEGDKYKSFPVSKYGLLGTYHILLEGCTYPPEKRSAMAQSVGPMTALLCHIRSESKYRRKWTDAAKRAMSHVPLIDDILEQSAGKPAAEISGMIGTLADILLITTSRQAHRMFFPICFISAIYNLEINSDGKFSKAPHLGFGGNKFLQHFNVSGSGGFHAYKLACAFPWTMEGEMTSQQAAQIVFHGVFGTYKEDLSVLGQITNQANWYTREEMGKCFQKPNTSGKSVTFDPIGLKYYSKLSSANQTGKLASAYTQVSAIPVFSGFRRQEYGDDFFE